MSATKSPDRATSRYIGVGFVWTCAVAVVLAAIYLDYKWSPAGKRDGPPVVLVVALLVLLALWLAPVREALRRVTGVKVAGLEVSLAALSEAAVDPLTQVFVNEEEGDPERKQWQPTVIKEPVTRFAEANIEALSDKLTRRLDWIWENLPDLGKRPAGNAQAVERLEARGLLPSTEAQILHVFATIELDEVAQARRTNRKALERFLLQADAVVHTSRLIAFDSQVRSILREKGFVLVDWRPQPVPQRWRDFLAHGRGPMAERAPDQTFWIAVRTAERKDSKLFASTVKRLASERWRSEVPGGREAKPLIVVPNGSEAPLDKTDADVEAVKLRDLALHVSR
jgi:hypothetical protein